MLTATKPQLALALFGRNVVRAAAHEPMRSIAPCKSQLKSIYKNTGCHGHSELVKSLFQVRLAEWQ
jgi:hypothetical protein